MVDIPGKIGQGRGRQKEYAEGSTIDTGEHATSSLQAEVRRCNRIRDRGTIPKVRPRECQLDAVTGGLVEEAISPEDTRVRPGPSRA